MNHCMYEKDVIVAFLFSILSCTVSSPFKSYNCLILIYMSKTFTKKEKNFCSGTDFWSSFYPKLKSLPIEGEEERG